MGIKKRDIPKARITNNLPDPPEIRLARGKPTPEIIRKMILKLITTRIGRIITGIISAATGTLGAVALEVDLDSAILMGLTALILIAVGPDAAQFFKKLFEKEEKPNS